MKSTKLLVLVAISQFLVACTGLPLVRPESTTMQPAQPAAPPNATVYIEPCDPPVPTLQWVGEYDATVAQRLQTLYAADQSARLGDTAKID